MRQDKPLKPPGKPGRPKGKQKPRVPLKRGRKAHAPTDQSRSQVELQVVFGSTQAVIAANLGVSETTLRHYYAKELAGSDGKYGAMVLQSYFFKCVGGPERNWEKADRQAQENYLVNKAGWMSSKQRTEISGPDKGPIQAIQWLPPSSE